MNILLEKNNEQLKIFLIGKLDATNAPSLELKVHDELAKVNEVIIDASGLEYISSAGLRVILKIKHAVENTSIINATVEVYDIFEMTGFSEMMSVSKKLREISLENCKLIGKGACGSVYRISKDTIVKVYKDNYSIEGIKRERELARKAFILGIPTAIPYDMVKVGDNLGAVFELLDATTLQNEIINNPSELDKYIDEYVSIMKIIHKNTIKEGEITDKKAEVIEWAQVVAEQLDKKTGEKLIKLLKGIKTDNHLIHGDYHIKNIMMQNGEPFIIDMDTLAIGSPIFEFGFMYSCYQAYQEIDKLNGENFFGIKQTVLDKIFHDSIRKYFDGKNEKYLEELIKKARVISYVQLIERFTNHKSNPDELVLFRKEITELISELNDLNL